METVKIVNYIEKRIKDCRAHKYEIKELSHTDIVTIGDDEYVLPESWLNKLENAKCTH